MKKLKIKTIIEKLSEMVVSKISIKTAKLWNNITDEINNATTIGKAKSAIKKYCKTLEL